MRRGFIDEIEINVYGAKDDTRIIGEATVRLGTRLIKKLGNKRGLKKYEA